MARMTRIFVREQPRSLHPIRVIRVIRGRSLREIPVPGYFNRLLNYFASRREPTRGSPQPPGCEKCRVARKAWLVIRGQSHRRFQGQKEPESGRDGFKGKQNAPEIWPRSARKGGIGA